MYRFNIDTHTKIIHILNDTNKNLSVLQLTLTNIQIASVGHAVLPSDWLRLGVAVVFLAVRLPPVLPTVYNMNIPMKLKCDIEDVATWALVNKLMRTKLPCCPTPPK